MIIWIDFALTKNDSSHSMTFNIPFSVISTPLYELYKNRYCIVYILCYVLVSKGNYFLFISIFSLKTLNHNKQRKRRTIVGHLFIFSFVAVYVILVSYLLSCHIKGCLTNTTNVRLERWYILSLNHIHHITTHLLTHWPILSFVHTITLQFTWWSSNRCRVWFGMDHILCSNRHWCYYLGTHFPSTATHSCILSYM
jgi:hypothetical protein